MGIEVVVGVHLKDPPTKMTPPPIRLNRKERKERKEDAFVRDTQKVLCDVFAFLAVLSVQVGVQSVDCATFSGWIFVSDALATLSYGNRCAPVLSFRGSRSWLLLVR